MRDRDRQHPRLAEIGERRAEERKARLARALRDNLGRRKAQQRARAAEAPAGAASEDPPPSAKS